VANRAELDLLGDDTEEYVGHPVAQFHADRHVIVDILPRLNRGGAAPRSSCQTPLKSAPLAPLKLPPLDVQCWLGFGRAEQEATPLLAESKAVALDDQGAAVMEESVHRTILPCAQPTARRTSNTAEKDRLNGLTVHADRAVSMGLGNAAGYGVA